MNAGRGDAHFIFRPIKQFISRAILLKSVGILISNSAKYLLVPKSKLHTHIENYLNRFWKFISLEFLGSEMEIIHLNGGFPRSYNNSVCKNCYYYFVTTRDNHILSCKRIVSWYMCPRCKKITYNFFYRHRCQRTLKITYGLIKVIQKCAADDLFNF